MDVEVAVGFLTLRRCGLAVSGLGLQCGFGGLSVSVVEGRKVFHTGCSTSVCVCVQVNTLPIVIIRLFNHTSCLSGGMTASV